MKILIVTSEVTFVPDNYNQFLEELFVNLSNDKDISLELVILKNNSVSLILVGLYLMLSGARAIGYNLLKNSIKARFKDRLELTKKYKIPMHFFENPNSPEFHYFVTNCQTDLLVNARTRYIYKSKILKIPRLGAINIHHGLLPDYRGTMCDLWALLEERPTGFSIHVMEKKIDNGAIIRRVETSTHQSSPLRNNFADLLLKSSKREGIEMARILKIIKETNTIPIEKNNIALNPTYTKNPDFNTIRKMLQKGIKL